MYKLEFALIQAYLAHCGANGVGPTWEGAAVYRGTVKLNYLADCDCHGWKDTPIAWRDYLVSTERECCVA